MWTMTRMTLQYFFMAAKSFWSCFLPSASRHLLQALVKAFFLLLCLNHTQGAQRGPPGQLPGPVLPLPAHHLPGMGLRIVNVPFLPLSLPGEVTARPSLESLGWLQSPFLSRDCPSLSGPVSTSVNWVPSLLPRGLRASSKCARIWGRDVPATCPYCYTLTHFESGQTVLARGHARHS